MSKLYFSYSAMNAGKSATLLQAAHNYRERGMTPQLWTASVTAPAGATRGEIASRIGLSAPSRLFSADTDLHAAIAATQDKLHAVFVDEAQFLTEKQAWQLARVADELKLPVLCYGLRTDFTGRLFEGAAALLAIADHLREVRTICHCGRKATMTARVGEGGEAEREGEQVEVEKEAYVALCRKHFREQVGR